MWFWPPFSEGVIHWLFIQENIIDVAGYQFNESLRLVEWIVSWLCLNCSVTWLYPSPTLLWSLLNILSPNCSLVPCGEPGNEATLTGQPFYAVQEFVFMKRLMSTSLSLSTYSKLHKPDNDISTLWVWMLPCVCVLVLSVSINSRFFSFAAGLLCVWRTSTRQLTGRNYHHKQECAVCSCIQCLCDTM